MRPAPTVKRITLKVRRQRYPEHNSRCDICDQLVKGTMQHVFEYQQNEITQVHRLTCPAKACVETASIEIVLMRPPQAVGMLAGTCDACNTASYGTDTCTYCDGPLRDAFTQAGIRRRSR